MNPGRTAGDPSEQHVEANEEDGEGLEPSSTACKSSRSFLADGSVMWRDTWYAESKRNKRLRKAPVNSVEYLAAEASP